MEETQEQSKSALKKAQKAAKLAAGKAEKAAKASTIPVVGGASNSKKGDDSKEIIGITTSKETHFSQWYQELVVKAELVEYYTEVREICASRVPCQHLLTDDAGQISGFFILRRKTHHLGFWSDTLREDKTGSSCDAHLEYHSRLVPGAE